MIRSISYSRYFSTATAQASGTPATGVHTRKLHSSVPSEPLTAPGAATPAITSTAAHKTVIRPT
jgi:hypothetical protein